MTFSKITIKYIYRSGKLILYFILIHVSLFCLILVYVNLLFLILVSIIFFVHFESSTFVF